MVSSPPIAVYDACVLYPFQLRNLLVQCAADRLVDARWSNEIHDEWIRSLLARETKLTRARLEATRDLMERVLPQARVTGYEARIPTITLPDPDDRHVVAAAAEAGASVIVTWNIRDFPAAELRKHGLRKLTPDGSSPNSTTPGRTLLRPQSRVPDGTSTCHRSQGRHI
jgi:predicted nucleic acid-binding protein